MFKFKYSYKNMFYYEYENNVFCVYGDLYRNEMMPSYSYNDFLITFICDTDIDIDVEK